jgi:hypothetical protein
VIGALSLVASLALVSAVVGASWILAALILRHDEVGQR